MPFAHHINNSPLRRGATICPNPVLGVSGTFHEFDVPQQTNANYPCVDQAALGEGLKNSRPVEAGDFAVSGANEPASVVLAAAGVGRSHAVHKVDFSYSDTPTNGVLTVTDGTTTYSVSVTTSGPGPLEFSPPMIFLPNAAVSGSLSAGGGSVVGRFGFSGRAIV